MAAGFADHHRERADPALLAARAWLRIEESLAGVAAVLIVGVERPARDVLSVLWLAAIASGVVARGGRVHWVGRSVVLCALALPVLLEGRLSADHAALCVATMGLLLSCGRLTRELGRLLRAGALRRRPRRPHRDARARRLPRRRWSRPPTARGSPRPVCLLLLDLDGFGVDQQVPGPCRGRRAAGLRRRAHAATAGLRSRRRAPRGRRVRGGRRGEDAGDLAQALLEALAQCSDETRRVSACVGVAQTPRDGCDAEALLRAADIALRVAKRSGVGGQVSFYAGGPLSGQGAHCARSAPHAS